jgi:hypothetical protein
MSGPLTGIRVIEIGTLIAAPFAARLMAEFGAEVDQDRGAGRRRPDTQMAQAARTAPRCGGICSRATRNPSPLNLKSRPEGIDDHPPAGLPMPTC